MKDHVTRYKDSLCTQKQLGGGQAERCQLSFALQLHLSET